MTICRFFAQGTCRYGDRCRFEHVENSYSYNKQSYRNNQWNSGNYNDRYGSNYNHYSNDYRNEAYESRNYYNEGYGGYASNKYNEDYVASNKYNEKFTRFSDQNNQQQYSRQGYEQQFRSNEQSFGKKQPQYSYEYGSENRYGQNRFRWLSDDYKNQTHEYEYGNETYTTSTPKGKPSFSFKVPESEVKKESIPFFQTDEQDHLWIVKIQEDAKLWELGGQWPFTCYFPFPNKYAFPGFYDVSPEELRYAAYKAEEKDSSKTYVQAVQIALNQVNQQRSELQIVTPHLLTTLRRIKDGEDLHSTSKKINPIVSIDSDDNVVEIMETPDISVASNNAAASFSFKTPMALSNAATSFSFKIPSETDSGVKTTASSFSFKLPSDFEIKSVTASDGDVNIYTPLGNLTDDEKEQFSASTFVLGKIPTKPPSLVFCN